MKNHIIFIIALALIGSLSACTKKKAEIAPIAKPSENPMLSVLSDSKTSTFEIPNDYSNRGDFGFKFSTVADGKITQLGCKMPETGVYTVTLWEEYKDKPLRQKSIEISTPGKLTLSDIDPYTLKKDVKYLITVNNVVNGKVKKYYGIQGENAKLLDFPKVYGNILMISPAYKNNTLVPTYPDGTDGILILFLQGLPDFTFIPN